MSQVSSKLFGRKDSTTTENRYGGKCVGLFIYTFEHLASPHVCMHVLLRRYIWPEVWCARHIPSSHWLCCACTIQRLGIASLHFSDLLKISCSPHQPSDFTLPKRAFGKVFLTLLVVAILALQWIKRHSHTCVTGFRQGKMRAPEADTVIVSILPCINASLAMCQCLW